MPSVSYGSVPFAEQLEFFRSKLNIPTESWTDIYGAEHDYAFMVAGANRDALVGDFRTAVERVIAEGGTLESFRQDFDRIVADHGWDYNGGREWRSRTIYETNLFSSYNAGRYEQLRENMDVIPYWQYRHSDAVSNPRAEHLKWNNMILRADNPWWDSHYPINAWGCQCDVQGLTDLDLEEMGASVDDAPEIVYVEREIGKRSPNGARTVRVPEGIDPGFEHAPGRSRLLSQTPPELPNPPISGSTGGRGLPNTRPQDALGPARSVSASRLLPENLTDTEYANAFLNRFGATVETPVIFEDVIGERLMIGAELFTARASGQMKANKNNRGKYMLLLAEAVADPDEIWVRMEYQLSLKKTVVRRRYIARFKLPDQDARALAVFEWSASGWSGITVFKNDQDIEDMRIGVRVYKK